MAVFLQPIYTQTVGAGGAASITFNNIPQTFTDLLVVASVRSSTNSDPSFYWGYQGGLNGLYSLTRLAGTGSSTNSTRQSALDFHRLDGMADGTGETALTFSSVEIYLPNYTSSNFKQSIANLVSENNATAADMCMASGLCRTSNAITSFGFAVDGTMAQYSTATLYGILRSGV